MKTNYLSENQKCFLIEQFKRWGTNPILQDSSWQVKITEKQIESLITEGYLVNIERKKEKIKFNLSIKGQEFAREYLKRNSN